MYRLATCFWVSLRTLSPQGLSIAPIIVNDTNIFIDLHSIGLLSQLCDLPYEIRTVDFVMAEIVDNRQQEDMGHLVKEGKITVESFTAEELIEIVNEHAAVSGNLSIPDCSVCYYARKHDITLLTGDRQLRRYAESHNLTVHGILFIFDELVAHSVISPEVAAGKLKELYSINVRLPKSEIQRRIDRWGNDT